MKLESSEFDLVVEAGRTERHDRMDLWRYRELFCFLAWRLFYDLNSMAGVIDRFRWAIPGPEAALFLPGFYVSMGVILPQAATGVWYFRRTEKAFGDIN